MTDHALNRKIERREYRRVSDAVALHIAPIEGDAANDADMRQVELPDHPTHVVSLSPNGLRCFHRSAFTDGDILNLTIKLFPSQAIINLRGRVVSSGESGQKEGEDRYFAGIAFKGVKASQRELLLNHIEAIAKKSFGGAVKLIYKK